MANNPPLARGRDRWDEPSAKIQTTVPASLKRKLVSLAARDGITLGALVRRALANEITGRSG